MTKFTFTKHKDVDNKFDISVVTMEIEAVNVTDIVEEFKNFMIASGFGESCVKRALGLDEE
jgi:hypothetical protein